MKNEMKTTGIIGVGVILGSYWDNGKENGNYRDYRGWGYIEIILGQRKRKWKLLLCAFSLWLRLLKKGTRVAFLCSRVNFATLCRIHFTRMLMAPLLLWL